MAGRQNALIRLCILGATFICLVFLILLFLLNAQLLVNLNLQDRFYFLILGVFGLVAAIILFGFMKSYAQYRGEALGGVLELGGPVVVFALVLVLGFLLPPNQQPFDLTLYVDEAGSGSPLTQGKIRIRLGNEPREAPISEGGDAYFRGIPGQFRGQDISVQLDGVVGYRLLTDSITLDDVGIELQAELQPVVFSGYAKDSGGQSVSGAMVSIGTVSTSTDANGYFKLTVTGVRPDDRRRMQVTADGFEQSALIVVPYSGEVTVILIDQ